MRIIGITGRARSGKDACAAVLAEIGGYQRESFASGVRRLASALYAGVDFYGEGDKNAMKRFPAPDFEAREVAALSAGDFATLRQTVAKHLAGNTHSVRKVLQVLGTEWGRATDPERWIRALVSRLDPKAKYVITDVRFPNEADAIRALGGIIVKVDADERLGEQVDFHPSEVEMAKIVPDHTLLNNGSEVEFRRSVEGLNKLLGGVSPAAGYLTPGAFAGSEGPRVFALQGLPEEVAAVLFAYYSRSTKGLVECLEEMVREGHLPPSRRPPGGFEGASDKARAFHEKWVVGYGHRSVAEHAVVKLAFEGVSALAAKEIEDCRLASYTEKSTRYVRMSRENVVNPYTTPEARALFDAVVGRLFDCYEAGQEMILQHLGDQGTPNQRRTQALDLMRGCLPLGVKTNLGMTANAAAMGRALSKMRDSAYPEVRSLVPPALKEGGYVAPTLLPGMMGTGGAQTSLSAPLRGPLRAAPNRVSLDVLTQDWFSIPDPRSREAEELLLKFTITCDVGSWRDLQRHRMTTQTKPALHKKQCGWWIGDVPPKVKALIEGCFRVIQEPLAQLRKMEDPFLAAYATPLAFRYRWEMTANLRETAYLVRLRSSSQAHPSYRQVAEAMAGAVKRKLGIRLPLGTAKEFTRPG